MAPGHVTPSPRSSEQDVEKTGLQPALHYESPDLAHSISKNLSHKPRADYSSNGEAAARYEVTNLAHNPKQKWYFTSDQTPEEAWVIEIFDSKTDRARCAVHSSFPLKDQADSGKARQSVEVRCFVFWEDQEL